MEFTPPTVIMSMYAYLKILEIVRQSKKEVAWLGEVILKNDYLYIDSVYVPDQEVTGTTCEIDSEGLLEFAKKVPHDSIRYWGHSHVDMGVTPSGRDETEGKELMAGVENYFITSIHNKKKEFSIRLYVPFMHQWVECKLSRDLSLDQNNDINFAELREEVADEIKKNVKDKVYASKKSIHTKAGFQGSSKLYQKQIGNPNYSGDIPFGNYDDYGYYPYKHEQDAWDKKYGRQVEASKANKHNRDRSNGGGNSRNIISIRL